MCDQNKPLFSIFSKNICLFINNYLVAFTVTSLRYNTLIPAFSQILETLLKHTFWFHQQLLFRFYFFHLLNRSKLIDMITVLFLPKTYSQTSMCALVRYHGSKSMIDFSTIICVSGELILSIAA